MCLPCCLLDRVEKGEASGTVERPRLLLRRMGRTMSIRPGWMSMAAAYLAEQICVPSRDDTFLHVRGYNGEAAMFCLEGTGCCGTW
jgi:hypothetical protein